MYTKKILTLSLFQLQKKGNRFVTDSGTSSYYEPNSGRILKIYNNSEQQPALSPQNKVANRFQKHLRRNLRSRLQSLKWGR